MNTVTRTDARSRVKTTTLTFVLLALCAVGSMASFAGPEGRTSKVTESGTVSLAGLDMLTPEGVRLANWRIQQMAKRLCLQIIKQVVSMDQLDAATCVDKAVADAQQKLNAVIQARLAEREVHTAASAGGS